MEDAAIESKTIINWEKYALLQIPPECKKDLMSLFTTYSLLTSLYVVMRKLCVNRYVVENKNFVLLHNVT